MRIIVAAASAIAASGCLFGCSLSPSRARVPSVEFACETQDCPLRFEGNVQVPGPELAAEVAQHEAPPGTLFRDLVPVLVRAAYYDRGFVDARVSAHPEVAKGGGGHALVVAVDEGTPYWVCQLSVTDPASLPGEPLGNPAALRAAVPEPQGTVFARRALIDDVRGVLASYRETGYAWADADVAVRRDGREHCVTVDILVQRGPATIVDRVEVHGGNALPDDLVQVRLSMHAGDVYRASAVRASSRALEELVGTGRTVDVSETPVTGHPERVAISFGIRWLGEARASGSGKRPVLTGPTSLEGMAR